MKSVPGVKVEQMLSKTSYQVKTELRNKDMSPDTVFDSAVEDIMLWLRNKLNNNPKPFEQLLKDARQNISVEHGGIQVDIAYISEPLKWAMKFRQPDGNHVARAWATQAVIEKIDDTVIFSTINTCACPYSSAEDIPCSTPGFIKIVIEHIGFYDVRPIHYDPWELEDEQDLQALHSLLASPERQLPVVVLTQRNYTYSLDLKLIAKNLAGIAHIICIPQQLGYAWSDLVGREWSVYNGGVRTYFPSLDFKYSDIHDHPLVLADRIANWQTRNLVGADAFARVLTASVSRYNVKHTGLFSDSEIFNRMRQYKLSQEIARARDNEAEQSTLLALYQEENAQLSEDLNLLRQKYSGLEADMIHVELENDELKKERSNLLARLSRLEHTAFSEKGQTEEIPIPTTYDELISWCEEFLPQKLVLSTKAKQSIKDAQFSDVALVYKSLLLYANEYRSMRMRTRDDVQAKHAYKAKLRELGLEDCGRPISPARRGEQGDEYFTRFNGVKYELEHHIGKGRGSMDPLTCLRIYTVWDSENNRVIVGSLPGHLDLRISN